MISPFKKRTSDRSPTPDSRFYQEKKPVRDAKQHYTRRNLNEKITLLKDTIHRYIETGKNVKDKTHTMFIDLKPILKFT